MQFTQREAKLIEKLRKEERRWPWLRWLVLAMGILSTVLSVAWGWFLYEVIHTESLVPAADREPLDSMQVFLIFMLVAKCCFWLGYATWSFSIVIGKWHGDPNRMLLLRLIDAQQSRGDASD